MRLDWVEQPGERGLERKVSWSGQGTKQIKIESVGEDFARLQETISWIGRCEQLSTTKKPK